jgi:hypothetical protein
MNGAIKGSHIHCFVLHAISASNQQELGAVQAEDHAS